MDRDGPLSIRLLGELEVAYDGRKLALPQSRKTRALLAYLLLTRRSHRRERLCSLLWDVADDPRGALRWSLSKLRPVVDADRRRLIADRETAGLEATGAFVDAFALERAASAGLAGLSTDALEGLVAMHRGELLEGLDLGDFEEYQAWCIAEREHARARYAKVLSALLDRLEDDPTRALPHARALARTEPMLVAPHARLLAHLAALGRFEEAALHHRAAMRQFETVAPEQATALDASWAGLRTRRHAPSPVEQVAPPVDAPRRAPPPSVETLVPLPGKSSFVGRTRELRRSRATLDDAIARERLQVLLLVGEPGIGKSRLLEEILHEADARAAVTAKGRSWEVESGRPYAPWTDALAVLDSIEGVARADAATQAFLDGGAPASSSHEARAARERAFASIATRLRALARAGGLVLAFDDLQWCDEASAVLLHFVARSIQDAPVLLVLAARTGELVDNAPVLRAMRSLRREVPVTQLALEPLERAEMGALLDGIDAKLDADAVHVTSGGNPLYALELARGGAAEGELPDSLAELVMDRVERLSPDAREVLAFGAVLGRSFDVDLMGALAKLDGPDLEAALATLERHQLLSSIAAERPSYAFVHDAVRRVAYAHVSEPRRKLMHRRVAELLAPRAADGDEQASLVAHHALLGASPELAARSCIIAGGRALASLASATAESFARRGIRCAAGLPERLRVPLTVELFRILLAARRPSDVEDVTHSLSELAERALVLGDVEHARLGYQLLGYVRWEGGDVPDARKHLLEAEWVTRGADGPERMRALAEAGRCLALLERDLPEAEGFLLEASALAKQLLSEPASLVDAGALLACHRGDAPLAMAGFERARLLARREGEPGVELQVLEHQVMCALGGGDLDGAERYARELSELAERARGGSELPAAHAFEALVRHVRVGVPESELDEILEELRTADSKRRLSFVLNRAALADASRGHDETAGTRAREAYDAAAAVHRPSEMAISLAVRLSTARGDAATMSAERARLAELLQSPISAEAKAYAASALGQEA